MYMERDSERLKRFLICGVIFVIIAAMVYSNSVVFQLFDSMLQAFFTGTTTDFRTMLMKLVSFIGSPKMSIIYVLSLPFSCGALSIRFPHFGHLAPLRVETWSPT
jgi:hypothetical protein